MMMNNNMNYNYNPGNQMNYNQNMFPNQQINNMNYENSGNQMNYGYQANYSQNQAKKDLLDDLF